MKLLRYALFPAVIAGALLVGAIGLASASGSATLDGVTPTAAQQAAPVDAAAVCAKVTAAKKPHPVLRDLCGLYGDASLSGQAHDTIGKVIMTIASRHAKHGKHAPKAAPTPTATAAPGATD